MEKVRPDGRSSATMMRPMSCELGVLQKAHGSAQLSCGSSQVLVAVFGPVAPRSAAEESPETARISVVWDDTAAATFLQTTLEREVVNVAAYPRTILQIVIQVLDNTQNTNDEVGQKAAPSSASVVAVAYNATLLALMEAGIAMREEGLPIAISCLVMSSTSSQTEDNSTTAQNQVLLLDPSPREIELAVKKKCAAAMVLLVVTHKSNVVASQVVTVSGDGLSLPQFLECIEAASAARSSVLEFFKTVLAHKMRQQSLTLFSSS